MQPNKEEEERHQDSESLSHVPWNALLPLDSLGNTHESLLIQLTRRLLSESPLHAPLSTPQQRWLQWMVPICLWLVSVIWLLLKSKRWVSLSSHPVSLAEAQLVASTQQRWQRIGIALDILGPVGTLCSAIRPVSDRNDWQFFGKKIARAPWYYSTKNCRCKRKKKEKPKLCRELQEKKKRWKHISNVKPKAAFIKDSIM